MALPSFVSFYITEERPIGEDGPGPVRENRKYLRHIGTSLSYENEAGGVDPNTRFAIEKAATTGGLVHLRHCFTNKYLARGVDEPSYIKAESVEAVEDETQAGCTLFRYQVINENTISLVHIQSGLDVHVKHLTSPVKRSYLVLAGESGSVPLQTHYLNLDALLILPNRVIFKGDNNKYLGVFEEGGGSMPRLRFFVDDNADPLAQFEVVYHQRGYATIKSLYNGNFWYNQGLQVSLGYDSNDHPYNWIEPITGPNGTICIRCRGYQDTTVNEYGERSSLSFLPDFLSFSAPSMMPRARLVMEEPVVSRIVYVDFRLDDNRIFNAKPLLAASTTVRNESDYEHSIEMEVIYTKTRTSTWNNTVRVMAGITTTIVTKVPFIAEGKIETTFEAEYQHEFGGSVETQESVINKPIITLPPWTIATASVLATEGQCNIPFSYRQRDTLLSGKVVETVLHDGVYDNVNNYDFHTIIRVVDMGSPEDLDTSKSKDSAFPISRNEFENLTKIYKSKVAEARARSLDNLETTPTIIYETTKTEKPKHCKHKH